MKQVCVDKKLIDEEWKLNETGEPLPLDRHILNSGRTDDTDWVNATLMKK
ncbi:hypothetical protein FLA4_10310 [Candidatus Rickettsia kotlanii]|nr:hypothetical protein FLA4_10310 [Candidatus Rickettsia kotlanii]BDU61864.1 hypothetical protein HM2_10320 [Candidatus Rickettsia kotlanii]